MGNIAVFDDAGYGRLSKAEGRQRLGLPTKEAMQGLAHRTKLQGLGVPKEHPTKFEESGVGKGFDVGNNGVLCFYLRRPPQYILRTPE